MTRDTTLSVFLAALALAGSWTSRTAFAYERVVSEPNGQFLVADDNRCVDSTRLPHGLRTVQGAPRAVVLAAPYSGTTAPMFRLRVCERCDGAGTQCRYRTVRLETAAAAGTVEVAVAEDRSDAVQVTLTEAEDVEQLRAQLQTAYPEVSWTLQGCEPSSSSCALTAVTGEQRTVGFIADLQRVIEGATGRRPSTTQPTHQLVLRYLEPAGNGGMNLQPPSAWHACSADEWRDLARPSDGATQTYDVRVAPNAEGCADDSVRRTARLVVYARRTFERWPQLAPTGHYLEADPRQITVRFNMPEPARDHVRVSLEGVSTTAEWVDGACGAGGCELRLRSRMPIVPRRGRLRVRLQLSTNGRSDQPLHASNGTPISGGDAVRVVEVTEFRSRTLQVTVPTINSETNTHTFPLTHAMLAVIPPGEREVECRGATCTLLRTDSVGGPFGELRIVGASGNDNVLQQLRQAGGTAAFSLDDLDGFEDGLSIELNTRSCAYELYQASRLHDGMRDADVYFWAVADEPCLAIPLQISGGTSSELDTRARLRWTRMPTIDWWNGGPADTRSARLLALRVNSVAGLGDTTRTLGVAYLNGAAVTDGTNTIALSLRVRRGLDPSQTQAGIEMVPGDGSTERATTFLETRRALAIGHRNFVRLPSFPGLPRPYQVTSERASITACQTVDDGGTVTAELSPPVSGRLSWRALGDSRVPHRIEYCVTPAEPSDDLPVRIRLNGQFAEMDEGIVPPPPGNSELPRVDAGWVRITVPLPSRHLYQPWALPDSVALVCDANPDDRSLEAVVLSSGEPVEPMRRQEYRRCALRIALPDPHACEDGAAGTDPGRIFEQLGPQHLSVAVKVGSADQEQIFDLYLGPEIRSSIPNVTCNGFGRPRRRWSTRGNLQRDETEYLWIPLRNDLLATVDDEVDDYEEVEVRVKHMQGTHLAEPLREHAFIPPGFERNVGAVEDGDVARFRTRMRTRNGLTFALDNFFGNWSGFHVSQYGPRFTFSLTAGFSVLRWPHSGRGATMSETVDQVEMFGFDYGVIITAEVWNLRDNEGWIPFINPQLHFGLLLPQDFESSQSFFDSMSLIAGLGFRLPASSTPGDEASATATAIVWYELSSGARGTHHALVLGVNGTLAIGD